MCRTLVESRKANFGASPAFLSENISLPFLCLAARASKRLSHQPVSIKQARRSERPRVGNASLFTKCLFTILKPLYPPLPTSKVMDLLLNFYYRGPPTTHHPHKRPSSSGGIFGGWCTNCRNLRRRQNSHHPQFCARDVDRRFCGGDAWISRSDIKWTSNRITNTQPKL